MPHGMPCAAADDFDGRAWQTRMKMPDANLVRFVLLK
jgi:hypothetical protein